MYFGITNRDYNSHESELIIFLFNCDLKNKIWIVVEINLPIFSMEKPCGSILVLYTKLMGM
jgi:hypothetical protein